MRLSIAFSLIMIVSFFALLLLGAYAGPALARPVFGIPLSFLLGFAFIIGSFVLTALYAAIANRREETR